MQMLQVRAQTKHKFNYAIFFLMIVLLGLGCLFVYSASYYQANLTYGDKFFFLKKQLFGIAVGLVCFFVFCFFDYHILFKLRWWFFALGVVLLVLVFVPGIGVTNYGATRWINLKIISFQPSEFAKFAFVVASASILSKSADKVKSFKGILPVLFVGGVFCVLIILEPNMSITITMALLVAVMLFVGGAKAKHFALMIVPAVAVVVLLIIVEPYRLKRLVAFVDPFASSKSEGFQLVQSLLGISLGGFFGVGIFNSRQKYLFLPFSESDFIFSIIAEETGFFGSLFLLLLFVLLFVAIVKVSKNAKDRLGSLLSIGVGSILIIQVILNLSVCSGLVPPTGLPLPLISAGSTSIMVFMAMLGLVQNVHRQSVNKL